MRKACFVIAALLLAGPLIVPSGPTQHADASSTWSLASYSDFNSRTNGSGLDHLSVSVEGATAGLELARVSQGWARKDPGGAPSARFTAMAAVNGSDQVVIFGGQAVGGSTEGDTWAYDLRQNSWSQKSTASSPGARSGHSMATVCPDDKVVLYGGISGSGIFLCDTWVYDLSEGDWQPRSLANGPGPRRDFGICGVFGTAKVVLFGGSKEAGGLNAETWVYDVGQDNWSRISPALSPPAREHFTMAPVGGDDKVVLFGGYNGTHLLGDTWVFDVGEGKWYRKIPAKNPAARRDAGLAMAEGASRVMLYGGLVDTNLAAQDTWVYDIQTEEWTAKSPAQKPSKRYGAAMTTVLDMYTSVIFGGYDTGGNGLMSDTWTYSESSYVASGHFLSPCKDLGVRSSLRTIEWNADIPPFTGVSAQVKGGDSFSEVSAKPFAGPGGDPSRYYISGDTLWEGCSGRWFQYELRLTTANSFVTPTVHNITIGYNRHPEAPDQESPAVGVWLSDGRPAFSWNYSDTDGKGQAAFHWELSDTPDFSSIARTSGERRSEAKSYTPEVSLADGLWYWRVRTCDDEGGWGSFSAARAVMIDKTAPNDFSPVPDPPGWTSGDIRIAFSTSDDASGIGGYEVSVDGGNFTKQKSPYTPRLPGGMHAVTVRAYDLAGNYAEGCATFFKDDTPPEPFTPTVEPPDWSPASGTILFATNDSASGMHHYEISIDDGPFSVQASPYALPDLPDGNHTVVVRAYDRVGNHVDRPAQAYVDRNPPLQFKAVLEPAGWARADPKLTFRTTDPTSGVDRYEVSVDNGPFERRDSPCTLSGLADGAHNITVRAYDRAGNFMDSLVVALKDAAPPAGVTLQIDNGARETTDRKVRLSISALDHASGVDRMCYSTDGKKYSSWEQFAPQMDIDLPEGAGGKVVHVKVMDAAGNEAGAVSASIDFQPRSLGIGTASQLVPIAAIVILAVIGSVIWTTLRKRNRTPK